MHKYLSRVSTSSWLLIVMAVALVERAMLYLLYRPVLYNDTASYRRLAGQLLEGWNYYDGTRMPGYPLFLAWIGPDEHVYLVQLGLGVIITLLFFYIGWQVSGQGWFAALAACAYTLNLQQLLFEADLLAETVTVTLIAIYLAAAVRLFYERRNDHPWQVVLVGLLAGIAGGMAALTRTLYVFLPPLLGLFLFFFLHAKSRLRVVLALTVGLAGMALLALWVNFVHRQYGLWGFDTIGGYHLVNHAGPFFEFVPDEYSDIRDTMIKYRDAQVAETGHSSNAIWDAIPDLTEISGLGFVDLSRLMGKISLQLILEHPGLYLRNVGESWLAYWKVPIHWAVPPDAGPGFIRRAITLTLRAGLFLVNLSFVGGSLAMCWKKARSLFRMESFFWLVLTIPWITSITQAMLEYGDNPRYSVPTQTLVILIVAWWLWAVIRHLLEKKHETFRS